MSGVEILSALIAAIAIYIAYQQWSTNKLRLKHELYDRRFKVYKAVQIHLSHVLTHAKIGGEETAALANAMQDARFLMNEKMHNYIHEIYIKSIKMRSKQEQYKDLPVGDERSKLVEEEHENLGWLTDQLPKLHIVFGPFLKLSK